MRALLFGLMLLLLSCTQETRTDPAKTVVPRKSKAELKWDQYTKEKPATVFRLAADRDTLIQGDKGCILKVGKNAFVDANGQVVQGEVKVELQEILEVKDMLRSKVSTVSDQGILETYGMVKITASSEGRELKLSPGKTLEVAMPKRGKEADGAKLFYGIERDSGIIEWELAEEPEVITEIEPQVVKDITIRYPFLSDMDVRKAEFRNNRAGEELLDSLITFTEAEKAQLAGRIIRIHWLLFDDGDLEVFGIEGPISDDKKAEITEKLSGVPFIAPFEREGEAADLKGHVDIFFGNNDVRFDNEQSDSYWMTINRLGWINCDVFINYEGSKTDVVVKAPEGAVVKMKFKKFDSVITPYNIPEGYLFQNLPEGESVSLIIIAFSDEEIRYSQTETVVKEDLGQLLDYEIVTMEELDERLESLN